MKTRKKPEYLLELQKLLYFGRARTRSNYCTKAKLPKLPIASSERKMVPEPNHTGNARIALETILGDSRC